MWAKYFLSYLSKQYFACFDQQLKNRMANWNCNIIFEFLREMALRCLKISFKKNVNNFEITNKSWSILIWVQSPP